MTFLKVENISKHFKVLNREEGLLGAIRNLFSNDYSIVKAVDKISFNINRGEIIGYLGPNGAGKSTTIKMMVGILEPTDGHISVNGIIPYQKRTQYVKNIGIVFGQRSQLWWELPLIESFKILKKIYQIDDETYHSNLKIFQELVDIKGLFHKPVRHFSLGQKMLCEILASFLHNPDIVFLDEPTIGLDVSIKSKIRYLIQSLNEIRNTTIILTTHDISDVDALCNRIIIIDKGKKIFDDKKEKLTNIFGVYRTLNIDISDSNTDLLTKQLTNEFNLTSDTIQISNSWLKITINQEKQNLVDVLNYIVVNFKNIKDIKIDEISTENIIKKIYEGDYNL